MKRVFTAYHGTPSPHVNLTTAGERVVYFTDDREIAANFAFAIDRGGLLSGETPTLIHARIVLDNPRVLCDNEWEAVADDTNIDKAELIAQGYDGIVCMDVLEPTYIVAFHEHQFEILKREPLKNLAI